MQERLLIDYDGSIDVNMEKKLKVLLKEHSWEWYKEGNGAKRYLIFKRDR